MAKPDATRPTFLTLVEAAAVARTAPATIRYWIWQGRLTAYKPGRSVLVKEAELLQLIEHSETRKLRAAAAEPRGRHAA
jgi:excisionase family DNA binding protein